MPMIDSNRYRAGEQRIAGATRMPREQCVSRPRPQMGDAARHSKFKKHSKNSKSRRAIGPGVADKASTTMMAGSLWSRRPNRIRLDGLIIARLGVVAFLFI